jgi:hypothetical protein
MIFPRLFTCPTLATPNFKVGKTIYCYWNMYLHVAYILLPQDGGAIKETPLPLCNYSNNMYYYYLSFSEFEVNIVIVLRDNNVITENFPIQIIRF